MKNIMFLDTVSTQYCIEERNNFLDHLDFN